MQVSTATLKCGQHRYDDRKNEKQEGKQIQDQFNKMTGKGNDEKMCMKGRILHNATK